MELICDLDPLLLLLVGVLLCLSLFINFPSPVEAVVDEETALERPLLDSNRSVLLPLGVLLEVPTGLVSVLVFSLLFTSKPALSIAVLYFTRGFNGGKGELYIFYD